MKKNIDYALEIIFCVERLMAQSDRLSSDNQVKLEKLLGKALDIAADSIYKVEPEEAKAESDAQQKHTGKSAIQDLKKAAAANGVLLVQADNNA